MWFYFALFNSLLNWWMLLLLIDVVISWLLFGLRSAGVGFHQITVIDWLLHWFISLWAYLAISLVASTYAGPVCFRFVTLFIEMESKSWLYNNQIFQQHANLGFVLPRYCSFDILSSIVSIKRKSVVTINKRVFFFNRFNQILKFYMVSEQNSILPL